MSKATARLTASVREVACSSAILACPVQASSLSDATWLRVTLRGTVDMIDGALALGVKSVKG
jgi:hypothetical protein